MAYTIGWDESSPDGSENANTIDTEIQNLKTSIRERLEDFFPDWSNDGVDPKPPKSGYPRCELSRVGAQSIASGSAVDVIWTSEDLDEGGLYSGSGTDIVVPTALGGFYLVTAAATWAVSTAGTHRTMAVEINGSSVAVQRNGLKDATTTTRLSVCWMGVLVPTDIITISGTQDTASPLDFSAAIVGVVRLA